MEDFEMTKEQLIAKFKELYGADGEVRAYFAPGSENIRITTGDMYFRVR